MSKKLNDEDLRKHLKEQIYFLQSSAKLYDLGNEVEAKRMATVLRVLLFESPNPNSKSKSLLGQLHLRRSMQFFDTAQPYQSNNLLTQQCLVTMELSHDNLVFHPLFKESPHLRANLVSVVDWGNQIVMTDSKGNVYRRKNLIDLLSNKDGGAHVDAEIPDALSPLKSENVSSWIVTDSSGHENPPKNDVVYASMRQMTFEMLQSLYRVRPALFDECYF